jgi:5-methylcytosine-specific restriction enzyme A
MAWTGRSGPRTASSAVTTTAAWRRVRAVVLARDGGACQLRLPGCAGVATQADKVRPVAQGGDPFDLGNLVSCCVPCHKVKTQRDAAAGRVSERRPPERHPGLLGP